MTAEDVYKILLAAGEEVGLATVYRVLTQFEGAGLVIRHNFEGGRAVFEINQGSHHDHMVCIECGKIFEFQDMAIEERQLKVAEKPGSWSRTTRFTSTACARACASTGNARRNNR